MPVINDRTPNKNLALPHVDNMLEDDVGRLRSALTDIDADLHGNDVALAAKADLVDGKVPASQLPAYVDDVLEYANLAAFPATGASGVIYVALDTGSTYRWSGSAYVLLQATYTLPTATPSTLGGVKVGSGLNVGPDGTLSTVGGGGGSGLPVFGELTMVPASNGQTVFTPAGGYSVGQIELFLNGVLLLGNGDDYTASNGTTITLTVGANTTDTLFLRKWIYLPEAQAVAKTGDTMTGALNWAGIANVASAATCNIGLAASNRVSITGSTTITSFGTAAAGVVRTVMFAHGLTITHNVSSLILPGLANITAISGDTAEFESAGGGAWRCMWYQRVSNAPGKATSASKLDIAGTYQINASLSAASFPDGARLDFVDAVNGFPNYGTLLTLKSYAAGGGTLQLYTPYGNTTGGTYLQFRRANYDASAAWEGWQQIIDNTSVQTLTNKTLVSPDITENVVVTSVSLTAVRSRTYVLVLSVTLTLPASPAAGDWVSVVNRSGTLTPVIARNGQNIMGLAQDMTLDNLNASLTLVYADATRGWVWA